jgi:hypothetical protein
MREGDGAAQQARVADRLDRGDFGVQRREKTLPIYHCGPFQPAANAQAVGPRPFSKADSLDGSGKIRCKNLVSCNHNRENEIPAVHKFLR